MKLKLTQEEAKRAILYLVQEKVVATAIDENSIVINVGGVPVDDKSFEVSIKLITPEF